VRKLLLLALVCSAWTPALAEDPLIRLQKDPSPRATERLAELMVSTQDGDQRFWLVQALTVRLREHRDLKALEALLEASADVAPNVRGPALRGLSSFSSLPEDSISEPLLVRLGKAAESGAEDPAAVVRAGAADLRRAIDTFKDPSLVKTPLPPTGSSTTGGSLGRALRRAMGWICLPIGGGAGLVWALFGFPVLDRETIEGVRAKAAWQILKKQKIFLAGVGFFWLCLAALLAGYGFDLVVLFLGTPLYEVSGSWLRAYLAAGFCVFVPGAVLACGLTRAPERIVLFSSMPSLPLLIGLSIAVSLLLVPLGLVYRLLFRRAGRPEEAQGPLGALYWALGLGTFRAALLASSLMSEKGVGLLPALEEARRRWPEGAPAAEISMAAFDVRFGMLGAAPVLALLCGLVARGLPVEWAAPMPVVLVGCSFWAWGVLAGVLFAVSQVFAGVGAAATALEEKGSEVPQDFKDLLSLKDVPEEES